MTHYIDLTTYTYGKKFSDVSSLNVGWLDFSHVYTSGRTSQKFQERLVEFCKGFVNLTRGIHDCNICDGPRVSSQEDIVRRLGSAEIRVFYQGKVYAAPNLIYHYVIDHAYQPPAEFIEAVLNGPLPSSVEYDQLIAELGVTYRYVE